MPSDAAQKNNYPAWLEQAIFYQLYPQSFYDSNADGIGDLQGIIQKLDYLAGLGFNAIWINPCFESPFQDAGYDVSNYYNVAPRYGTNEDMKQLFTEASKRGMHILLDLVPGHTSIEHPWFKASCQHERNTYSDWFIWTDSVWDWDLPGYRAVTAFGERNGSYITNFFYFQPALNYGFANPDPARPWQQPGDAPGPRQVREELRNIMRFWLDMGASGFRVDMAGSLVKGDHDQREIKRLWQEMRAWLDEKYPEAVLISEWSNPTVAIEAGFHMDFLLPFGTPGWGALLRKPQTQGPNRDRYGASFFDRSGRGNIREFLDNYLQHYLPTRGKGLIGFPTGNHDVNTRLSVGRDSSDLKLIYLMLFTMPGVPFVYYGDEIGMRTVEGLPSKEGGYDRTGIRTPMQWDRTANAGFSTAPANRLYLPVDPRPDRPTVAQQEADPDSLLNTVRQLAALRRAQLTLQASSGFEVIYAEPGRNPFVYLRSNGSERFLVAINPCDAAVSIELPIQLEANAFNTLYGPSGALAQKEQHWELNLPPVSGGVNQLI
jgi:glycosidase